MDEKREEIKNVAVKIIEMLYQGEALLKSEFFSPEMEVWIPYVQKENGLKKIEANMKMLQKSVYRICHKTCKVVEQTNDFSALSGSYYVEWKGNCNERARLYYTLALKRDAKGTLKIRHLHISQGKSNEKRHYIKDVQERIFFIEEDELIYLEASHNHIIWHCKYFVVESVGSLKKMEEKLSVSFIRIQRSFIININHIKKIARCYAEMDNREIIQIPVKKYCDIKKSVLARKGE